MQETHIAVIGAGPHGLSAAAHLRRAGVECRVLGDPMSFWRTMPEGMLLRSNNTATGIADPEGPLSLEGYRRVTGRRIPPPVPLQDFIDYGSWVQGRVAPDVDRRTVDVVERSDSAFVLRLSDGERLRARRVVVAAGIADFVHLPRVARGLPTDIVSHTSAHRDLGAFRGRKVLVVGLGQSALESAALMRENGAEVEVVGRRNHINWLHGGKYHRRLGRLAPLFYAPTDVGPLGLSRLVAAPNFFRRLPRSVQDPLAYRAIRPAGAAWLGPRLTGISVTFGRRVVAIEPTASGARVTLDDGTRRSVDHVMFGTGYRVDVSAYPFLDPGLASVIATQNGYPLLRQGMESTSVAGLHFLGAPAAWSFGPTMRFVAGGWFGGRTLAESIVKDAPGRPRPAQVPVG
jgi:FAD-dependent urate hydroxylase